MKRSTRARNSELLIEVIDSESALRSARNELKLSVRELVPIDDENSSMAGQAEA